MLFRSLQAVECGHLRADVDPDQLVFDLDAIFTAVVRETRFLRDPLAAERGWNAYQRLMQGLRPASP